MSVAIAPQPTAPPAPEYLPLAVAAKVSGLSRYRIMKNAGLGAIRLQADVGSLPRYNVQDCRALVNREPKS